MADKSLYDLAAEIAALKAEVAQLKVRLDGLTSGPFAPAFPNVPALLNNSCLICGEYHGGLPCPNSAPMATAKGSRP